MTDVYFLVYELIQTLERVFLCRATLEYVLNVVIYLTQAKEAAAICDTDVSVRVLFLSNYLTHATFHAHVIV
jgi:hypothetical protein